MQHRVHEERDSVRNCHAPYACRYDGYEHYHEVDITRDEVRRRFVPCHLFPSWSMLFAPGHIILDASDISCCS